ncbi:FtsX-like permease family protein [Promicromonospora iranensis]|uniref:FtsX-like permease family protein n=1 Tax=Promicromonospora iranensis TaxID=1105144 RepID=UPI0023A97CBC|nr:ABC transporter permease [Promicromonospora iranensis]
MRARQAGQRATGAAMLISVTGTTMTTVVPGIQADVAQKVAETLFGGIPLVQLILQLLAWAFLAIAVATATSTATNSFRIVLDARLEEIALRRVLGSSATRERRRLTRLSSRIGIIGALLGMTLGTLVLLAVAPGVVTEPFTVLSIVVGATAMALATVTAAGRAAREVLSTTAITGLRLTRVDEAERAPHTPHEAGRALFVGGLVVVLGSVVASLFSPFAILVGALGGVAMMFGALSVMEVLLPAVLTFITRLGIVHGAAGVAVQSLRTRSAAAARGATGVFTSTAAVTTFVVALATLTGSLEDSYAGTGHEDAAVRVLHEVTTQFGLATSLLVVLCGIGLYTSITHSIRQRTREIATIRVLGQRPDDTRRMLLVEAGLLTASAAVPGLALGTFTGWAGAQDVLGTVRELGLLVPVLPWPYLLACAAGAGLLVLVSMRAAARHVIEPAPVRALATA